MKYLLLITFLANFICIKSNAQNKPSILFIAIDDQNGPDQRITWREVINEQDSSFYQSKEAIRVADNFLLLQAEIGGWDKIDSQRNSRDMINVISIERKEELLKDKKHRCSLDNGATYSQMRFLAHVYAATHNQRYKDGFLKGARYLLESQYSNGGWPQFYPLLGSYHDSVTFNDDAMTGAIWLLKDIATQLQPFDLAGPNLRNECLSAVEKGIKCILNCQIVANGKRTAWAQQYDEKTLKYDQGRVSELPSIASAESDAIVRFLMSIDNPSPEIVMAIQDAVRWFKKVKVTGKKLITIKDDALPRGIDKRLIDDPNATPIWGRYYEISTNRVMYIEEGTVHYSLTDLNHKHRIGHGWIGGRWPERSLKIYSDWKKKWLTEESYKRKY